MRAFADLIIAIDQTNKTNAKIDALVSFFTRAADKEKVWAIAILSGRRPKRTINTNQLVSWSIEESGIEPWLFEECYHLVGDLSENIALILPPPQEYHDLPVSHWMEILMNLNKLTDEEKRDYVMNAWRGMDFYERYIFNKLITGNFRIGVSQQTVINALSKYTGTPAQKIAHKLMGNWDPNSILFEDLIISDDLQDISQPYPFYLSYQVDNEVSSLGVPEEWQAEWKWDGIRGQLIKRQGEIFVWSRGEDLVTEKFPEYLALKDHLPDGVVIDGEILAFQDDKPLPFAFLQTRIGRKNVTKKILAEVPVILYAYDLLEYEGNDIRSLSLQERRALLNQLIEKVNRKDILRLSPELAFSNWEELIELRKRSREFTSEGLMLKRLSSPYEAGRKKGNWWKWKVDPLSVDAVLIYAQPGHGRRAGLYTDYTFAVWRNDELVPFAKAYSGLTDKEIAEVDRWIRAHTVEKFGPVRSVKPELVFELGFEGINASSRHKSGIAVRFPRILRWRKDKPVKEADTIDVLFKLLNE